MRIPHALLLALLAVAVALAGCTQDTDDHPGDDHHGDVHPGDDHHGSTGMGLSGDEDEMLHVFAGDPEELRFDRARYEVTSGARVGVMFHNNGQSEHEFAIEALDFHLHAQPGGVDSGAFIAPAPGEYTIGCYVPGHFEGGMQATLVVK